MRPVELTEVEVSCVVAGSTSGLAVRPVELTEVEASLVLSNWWFAVEDPDGPTVVEVGVPPRKARALNDVVSPHIFDVRPGVDVAAEWIVVTERRRRR